ncbi:MAG: tRNA pseudouridine(38-40) synthase TruA [Acidimicrobiia bacterium]|nr:tRNA pseudouridine(38-40) synthase TruA [Acidimicrobiia bacterium]
MPTYRLDFAYDGAPFFGYAIQKDQRTVQGDLEAALRPHTGDIRTAVAGRTDRGVHASGQVVSFVASELNPDLVLRSLNRQLAPHIVVSGLRVVDDDFSARFSATGRAYRYRVLDTEFADPLRASAVWHVRDRLDPDAMNDALDGIVGEHDFAALCRRYRNRSLVRRVEWARWHRLDDELLLSIGANAFCHQLVRSVVALTVDVGRGIVESAAVPDIIESRDRHHARGVAPPHGLVLVAVAYGDESLPRPPWAEETDDRQPMS